MSVKSSKSSKVAYMQEEDDLGNVRGDVTYAASAAPSPSKERMNISRKKSRRDVSPSAANHFTDSDSTAHPRRRESRSSKSSRPRGDRDRSVPPEKQALTRPATRHSKSTPVIETASQRRRSRDNPEAVYYGADPASIASAQARPRSKTAAPRPNSAYHASSRPPLSNSRYHSLHPSQPPHPSGMPPPSGFMPPPPPPQQWQPHPLPPHGYGMMPPPQPPMHPPGPPGPAFHHEPFPPPAPPSNGGMRGLQQRFVHGRPQTSMGHRPPPTVEYGNPDGFEPESDLSHDMRRLSMSHGLGMEDERSRPPSMRPMSARPMLSSPFAPPMLPPSGPVSIRGQPFQPLIDEPFEPLEPLEGSHLEYGMMHIPRTRRESIDPYQMDPRHYVTEVAGTMGSRRNSYYGEQPISSGNALDEKLRFASSYQDKTTGMATAGMRLTEEMLYEASRRGGPKSRSTRSSGSRDESDWRQSATTRTTRSSNEEDLTIRVRGNAVFKYGETEMHCQDGTEINIRGPPQGRRIGSSDKASYAERDDRRGRHDYPALRSRAASQSRSVYAPTSAPYEYNYDGALDYTGAPFDPLPAPGSWI
ncbi:uncharacterized protein SPSK_05147 [Sporothrix schenckii 1099-18]|uniref:Uncharacterized protein n=2 Tax=Sporothrix schenckii TaxID=29908 RepID=U7Q2P8_SPOS1|nr:uncharacterized protein SPSK_05147 [Sporothrix schenckii 1099-18]ERT02174.1 hypothetical protein HMPREF1624_00472 [Sporothrix schenckii ATCC 58251]KJR80612.1 hypothetical protein SPSK_05147 [Sporothrix schenckii 1099-18]